jgi:hypothetical protein
MYWSNANRPDGLRNYWISFQLVDDHESVSNNVTGTKTGSASTRMGEGGEDNRERGDNGRSGGDSMAGFPSLCIGLFSCRAR